MGIREALAAIVGPRVPEPASDDVAPRAATPADEARSSYYVPSAHAIDSSSYVPIITPASAQQSVAIRSTEDLIASLVSELPIDVYTGRGAGRHKLDTPSNLDDPGGDGKGREDWGYRLLQSWLGTGNAFGDVVQRDGMGRIITCDLFSPSIINVNVVAGAPVWTVSGREVMELQNFKHWRVNPVAGSVLGLSPIEYHAATIGVSLATTRFGRSWFADGMHSSGIMHHEGDLDAEQAAIAKARYMASLGSREPIVLAGKWGWEAIQISPEESQFLETAGYSEAQCARIFGPGFAEILGYETGQKMTYANVVDRRQDLLVFSIGRWMRRYERILSQFLPKPQWIEINRDALLEATTLQRYQAHNLALSAGWKTVNEVREHENLEPVPWGNEPPTSKPAAVVQPLNEKEVPADGNTAGS